MKHANLQENYMLNYLPFSTYGKTANLQELSQGTELQFLTVSGTTTPLVLLLTLSLIA